jgi:hypothetical protein
MDIDIQSDLPIQDQPLRSEAETPRGDFDEPAPPRRRRAIDEEVEKVQDETGEMVRGAFIKFLETYPLPVHVVLMTGLMMNLILNRLLRRRVRLLVRLGK